MFAYRVTTETVITLPIFGSYDWNVYEDEVRRTMDLPLDASWKIIREAIALVMVQDVRVRAAGCSAFRYFVSEKDTITWEA